MGISIATGQRVDDCHPSCAACGCLLRTASYQHTSFGAEAERWSVKHSTGLGIALSNQSLACGAASRSNAGDFFGFCFNSSAMRDHSAEQFAALPEGALLQAWAASRAGVDLRADLAGAPCSHTAQRARVPGPSGACAAGGRQGATVRAGFKLRV